MTFISGLAKGCSIVKQVCESLRGDLFSADSPWELGCVGGVCWIHEPRSQGSGASRRAPKNESCGAMLVQSGKGGGWGVEYLSRIMQTFCTPQGHIIGEK